MTTMSIHVEDAFAQSLRSFAQKRGKSVNQAVKAILAPALGQESSACSAQQTNGLGRLRGSIPLDVALKLSDFVNNADFSRVGAEDVR